MSRNSSRFLFVTILDYHSRTNVIGGPKLILEQNKLGFMSAIAIVTKPLIHHLKVEVFLSYVVLPLLGVGLEMMYHWLGLAFFGCLFSLNMILYHIFAGKLTSGSLVFALALASGSFMIEQLLASSLGLESVLFLFLRFRM